jgi:hypothetical protein
MSRNALLEKLLRNSSKASNEGRNRPRGSTFPRAAQGKHKNFEECLVPKRFRLQKHIPLKYESLLSTLSFGSKKVSFIRSDIIADAGFPRVVTPFSAGMA